ncbi:MAG: hypothetical protein J0I25_04105 [Sphingomonadales bacterium]|nr:hypothetical protein [Sphingomonadales bacterium]
MPSYSISDAIGELSPVLDGAPPEAVDGEWIATTMQAGASTCEGAYRDTEGNPTSADSFDFTTPFELIRQVVERLEASLSQPFNKVTIRWRRARTPFSPGFVALEIEFDKTIVPRAPDDPIYDAAAAARLAFWRTRGEVQVGFAAERGEANFYNQTKWFGPHRRVLVVRTPDVLTLATDGLSTPWAGVTSLENGVECELFMEFDAATMNDKLVSDWADTLLNIGDFVADEFEISAKVEKRGAILFYRLADEYSPLSDIILSRDTGRIVGLPFGIVPLVRATPITEIEIEDEDLSDEWATQAAIRALTRRRIAIPPTNNQII